jgi:hypothetical protein
MEKANVWRAMDANKADWKAQMAGTAQLRGIHIRRAKLLGLDAPTNYLSVPSSRLVFSFGAHRRLRQSLAEMSPPSRFASVWLVG